MSAARFTHDFVEGVIARLKAGEEPAKLREELGIGATSMARFQSFARSRVTLREPKP